MFKLRPYQENLINNCRLAFMKYKRPLIVLPCGGGKTICFSYMAQNHIKKNNDNYVWFLVHRKELIDQTLSKFDNTDRIFIGMVQTITKDPLKYKKPTMIIIDEAHHSTSKTYTNIIDKFPDIPIIGLTATPCRLDGSPLGNIYDCMIEGVSSKFLIENNYLSDYDYYAPNIDLVLPKMKGSDYDCSQIEFKSKIYGDILRYIDFNKKTIIYTPNIAFSQNLANLIPNSVHFDGNTNKKDRDRIINDFRSGKIKVLLNVDLIGEGFDVPDCDCVMLLRPTMSLSLFIQQSMRCLRPYPNKKAIIYDFVGNCYRHGLPTDNQDWSLDKKIKVRNASSEKDVLVRQCKKCFKVYEGINPICPYCNNDNKQTQRQIEQEKKAELERIEKIEKRNKRIEVGICKTKAELIEVAKKRGYSMGWVYNMCKVKGIRY